MARSQGRYYDRSNSFNHKTEEDQSRPCDTFCGKGSGQKDCHTAYQEIQLDKRMVGIQCHADRRQITSIHCPAIGWASVVEVQTKSGIRTDN